MRFRPWMKWSAATGLFAAAALASAAALEVRVVNTRHAFEAALLRAEKAIQTQGMGLVASASASRAAAARGVKIPGNAVLMVFRNDYAVRLLAASVPAGIEAPLRIYLTEEGDGSTTMRYSAPSTVFAPYGNKALDALGRELDAVFEKIVADAAAP